MADHDSHDREHIPPNAFRLTREDAERLWAELKAEAPEGVDPVHRLMFEPLFADRVRLLSMLKPTDDDETEPAASLKANALVTATLDALPDTPIEWPEGELPEQEPRSAENDDTVFLHDFEGPDTEYVDADVNADVDSPLSVPQERTRRAVRLLKLFTKAQHDLERKREVESTLAEQTSWMPARIISEDLGDFIEDIGRAIEQGETEEQIQRRIRHARRDLIWNSVHHVLMSAYHRLFKRTG
jgi:hypothetical protein